MLVVLYFSSSDFDVKHFTISFFHNYEVRFSSLNLEFVFLQCIYILHRYTYSDGFRGLFIGQTVAIDFLVRRKVERELRCLLFRDFLDPHSAGS